MSILEVADHVFETSSTVGTGNYQLSGAVPTFLGFATIGNNKMVPYVAFDGVNWETGIGKVVTGTPDVLQRTRILRSTNANAAVNWGVGTRNIRLGPLADTVPLRDENLNFLEGFSVIGGTGNALTFAPYPAPVAYSDGMKISGFLTSANSGAATAAVMGRSGMLPAKAIQNNGVALASGALPIGYYFEATFRSSTDAWQMTSPVIVDPRVATSVQGIKITEFTSSATWTPDANCLFAIVEWVGAGGGGGGYSVNSGTDGGDTTFDSIVAKGGKGGGTGFTTGGSVGDGGRSGSGSADIRVPGQPGGASAYYIGGTGGHSRLGPGGISGNTSGTGALQGERGGGGAGSSTGSNGATGGHGGGSGEYCLKKYVAPTAKTFTIGARGVKASGSIGTDGGLGHVVVTEYLKA